MSSVPNVAQLDDDLAAIHQQTLDFVANEVVPRGDEWEAAGQVPRDVLKKMGALGMFGLRVPEALGGLGLGPLASLTFAEALGSSTFAGFDVTGFGLLGHLVEMVRASEVDVELVLDAVPLMDGAEDTARAGILSSLQPQNVRLRRAVANLEEAGKDPRYPLIFDPQTAGGLLASVPADRADACVARLKELGYARTMIVGEVLEQSDRLEPITVRV